MKIISLTFLAGLGIVLALYGFGPHARAASVPALLSHRAVYDLELGPGGGAAAPSSARGRIVYEFSGSACEGYATSFRQLTETALPEADARLSDMRSSTFEDGEGRSFRFSSKSSVDGQPLDPLDGAATRSADGAISVRMNKPKTSQFDMAGTVYFPTAQIVAIIEAAREGQSTLNLRVFDGTDAEGRVYDTLTVIGHGSAAPLNNAIADQADALKAQKHWPVSISYFDTSKKDSAPAYTLSFDLYENGVSGNLTLDYGDYALKGQLTHFETLAQKPCP